MSQRFRRRTLGGTVEPLAEENAADRRIWTRARRCGLVLGVLVLATTAPAGPAAADGSRGGGAGADPAAAPGSTRDLIEADVKAGRLDRQTADVHLSHAFADWRKVPPRYQSGVGWHGTVPLLELKERLATMAPGAARNTIQTNIESAPGDPSSCSSSSSNLANNAQSTHFYVQYGTIGAGLTIAGYLTSLETAWTTQIDSFGWAAPPVLASNPPPGGKYHVRIDSLSPGLYGFVSSGGTHAGLVGDNPNTTWNEGDAYASCMVLNRDYSGFPTPPQGALDSTTAHEINHSIQYGLGALTGSNRPDSDFVEGGATWMEEEVFDSANDNYNYLWPIFADSMGQYDASPYPYWITFRGMTERYGAGVAGGAEQVMQDFWEATSRNTGDNLTAMEAGLANKGTTLADAFHAHAVAVKFNRACGGGYVYPYCLEEGPDYVARKGATSVHGTIASVGGTFASTGAGPKGGGGGIEDNYALNWVAIPAAAGIYSVTLNNTSSGGQLRASAVCDTGSELVVTPFPAVVEASAAITLASFNSASCISAVAVITNQSQTAANPSNSVGRTYALSTAGGTAPPGSPTLSISDVSVTEGAAGTTTPAQFTVSLSATSTQTVTVNFATSSSGKGDATPGTDYVATSGTVTFPAGQTTRPVVVTVNGDNTAEESENFLVILSGPSDATIADGTGVGTILDDDSGTPPPDGLSFAISDASVTEGNSGTVLMTFTVTTSAASPGKVMVSYATANGTAVAPGDFTATSGSLLFASGESSKTVTVSINGDTLLEGDETFSVVLSGAVGATIADGTGVGTILNDDA